MPKKTITVIGINPGAKYLGVAVFRGQELRDWRVKVTKGKWTADKHRKTLRILSAFIGQYRPDAMAIKRLNPSRSSAGLDRLVLKFIALAEHKGIQVCQYDIKELEAVFQVEGRGNKREMAEKIAADYPALHGDLALEKRSKNSYHLRMFEAVALGAACVRELDNSGKIKD
jgi:Holliday junction resolvasome RuvABC endonuclease subunit